MGPTRLLLFLCAVYSTHGKPCAKNQTFYKWDFYSQYYNAPASANMTTLDKSLADHPNEYVKCFPTEKLPWSEPFPSEYKWTDDVYGRKKRDVFKYNLYFKLKNNHVEIPFLISANWSTCIQRRIALALRKFETKTCLKFVPFEGFQKHSEVLMITNSLLIPYDCGVATTGFGEVYDTTLDGQPIPDGAVVQLPEGCWNGVEHEIMHVLGFMHAYQSPYREGPSEWWEKTKYSVTKEPVYVTKLGPWERDSAVSGIGGDNTLTEWDAYKINAFYGCKQTTFGNKEINMNRTPPPPVNSFTDDPSMARG